MMPNLDRYRYADRQRVWKQKAAPHLVNFQILYMQNIARLVLYALLIQAMEHKPPPHDHQK